MDTTTHFSIVEDIPNYAAENYQFFTRLKSGAFTQPRSLYALRVLWSEQIALFGIFLCRAGIPDTVPQTRYCVWNNAVDRVTYIPLSMYRGQVSVAGRDYEIPSRCLDQWAPFKTRVEADFHIATTNVHARAKIRRKIASLRKREKRITPPFSTPHHQST